MKLFIIKHKDDGREYVHLESPIGGDYTLCGMDTAGDDSLYDADPIMTEAHHRALDLVTCRDCLTIVNFCKRLR